MLEKRAAAALLASTLLMIGCRSAAPAPSRWAIRVTAGDGTFIGGLVLEITSDRSTRSCEGTPGLRRARIVEKHGFDNDVHDEAAASVSNDWFYVDLTPGICDGAFVLDGRATKRRAAGVASRGSPAGLLKVGNFVAEAR